MRDVVRKQYQRLFYWIILDINMPVNFFSLSTGEQKGVVVMVVGGEGGRLGGGCLSVPYTRYKFRSLPPVSRLSQFVCVVFFWGGGRGAWEWAGVGGIEKAIESFQIFHYPQAFIHISKYENIDSDTESVFTLDSAFKISRHATKPNLMCVCVCVFFFPDSLFTFEDENNHEDEIWLKVFPRILRKYTKESSQGYFYWRRLSPTSFPGFSPSCPFGARKHSLSLNKLLAGWYLLKWILLLLFFKSEALLPHWAVDLVQSSPFRDLTSGALCYFVYVIFQCWSLFSCPFILQLGSCHWSVQRELESRRLNSLCKG